MRTRRVKRNNWLVFAPALDLMIKSVGRETARVQTKMMTINTITARWCVELTKWEDRDDIHGKPASAVVTRNRPPAIEFTGQRATHAKSDEHNMSPNNGHWHPHLLVTSTPCVSTYALKNVTMISTAKMMVVVVSTVYQPIVCELAKQRLNGMAVAVYMIASTTAQNKTCVQRAKAGVHARSAPKNSHKSL